MSFTIEKAKPEDAAALIEYLNTVGGETDNLTFGAGEFPATAAEEADFLRREGENPRNLMLAAWEEGRVIGSAHLGALSRRLAHRGSLGISVLRDCWGRGVGSALMEGVIAHAREQGLEIIELEVRSDNPRAIRLYKKFGFVTIGRYPRFFKINGAYADCELMNLYLRDPPQAGGDGMELHDRIVRELEKTGSLAALVWLVDRGREVEFTAAGQACFLSRSRAEGYVSLWAEGAQQSFDSVEALLENAVIGCRPFLEAWGEAEIETIF